ncbi:MAG: helix-turn-helix domain-containing protein [Actinomycetota bacterium]|nr:helix-turn-helix domain-containing protein [Actinomycetota bacterium]
MARRPEPPRGATPPSVGNGGTTARRGIVPAPRPAPGRGRYFTIPQALEAYPGVLTERLIRRLVAERRIAYTYAGRRIVLAEADIEAYLEANRHEPVLRRPAGHVRPA